MTSANDKVRARGLLNRAVQAGRVTARPCETCGAEPAQGHHDDYSKPLDVRWLCAACHSQLHNQKHALTKVCVVCGVEFTPHPTKRARAKTCSPACRAASIARTKTADPNPTRPTWTKLTPEKAVEIRRRRAEDGASTAVLVDEFGVTRANINAVLRGAIWADAAPKQRAKPEPATTKVAAA